VTDLLQRCSLPTQDPRFLAYHDTEWGRPVTSDSRLYEKVCLEGFQAGLSWSTILYRRKAFREAFSDFDIDRVAAYRESDKTRLLANAGVIRNRRKIESAIHNAGRAQRLRDEFGSLAAYFWSFEPDAQDRPAKITAQWLAANPSTPASTALARDLKSRGWTFVGPTTMYALMQACGLVNDHLHHCHAREPVERLRQALRRPTR